MFSYKGRQFKSYYRWILFLMLVFAFVLFVPFSFISYRISADNISGAIAKSNGIILSQINSNYASFTEGMNNTCLEIFLNSSVQQFLYSSDIDANEIRTYMRNLANTTGLVNSALDSIALYNSKMDEWFVTKAVNPSSIGQELQDFINDQDSIPKLKPVLRKVMRSQGNLEIPVYLFSSFMYQFTDPAREGTSFIVVNENASWLLNNFALFQQTEERNNSIYLVNESGIVYHIPGIATREAEDALIDDFIQNHAVNEGSSHYIKEYKKGKYFISSVYTGYGQNYLLIIQNYNEVFRDLIRLQREFIRFGAVFLLAIVLLLSIISKRIYRPFRSFVSQVLEFHPDSSDAQVSNEFEYLQNIYQHADELNKSLLLKSEIYEPVMEQYRLSLLVNNDISYNDFSRTMEGHWLAEKNNVMLRVVLIKIDKYREHPYRLDESEIPLLFDAIKNVIHSLFDNVYEFSVFLNNNDTLCVILNIKDEDIKNEKVLSFIEKSQITIKRHFNVTLSAAYSKVISNPGEISKTARQAGNLLSYRFVLGPGSIVDEHTSRPNIENTETHYNLLLDEKLLASIAEGNAISAAAALEDIKKALCGFEYNNIIINIMALVNKVAAVLGKTARTENSSADMKIEVLYKKAIDAEFMQDFFQELESYITLSLEDPEKSAGRKTKSDEGIQPILDFINNNYQNQNLCSQMIGDHFDLSNRYVMYKFKKSTNISLVDYIVDVRMRKAANLLKNTGLPINQIADSIGLTNDTYFYKLFKKVYRCTPREFSQMYRGKASAP